MFWRIPDSEAKYRMPPLLNPMDLVITGGMMQGMERCQVWAVQQVQQLVDVGEATQATQICGDTLRRKT